MEITRRTYQTEGVTTTENAKYEVSYTISENIQTKELTLDSLACVVKTKVKQQVPTATGESIEQEVEVEAGTFRIQYGRFTCVDGFPYSDKIIAYLTDFNTIVQSIITKQ